MEMKQCAKGGHYYDASIHKECPYCANAAGASVALDPGATMPVGGPRGDAGRTAPLGAGSGDIGRTVPVGAQPNAAPSDDGRTVAIIKKEIGIDPVVGWLVCVEGANRGRDYRIHSDNNFVGRSEKMDICIKGDETISRENHAIISFDAKEKMFFFSPGDGRSIVRVNGKATFMTVELKAYDRVEIGETKLLFIPLCGEQFQWQ